MSDRPDYDPSADPKGRGTLIAIVVIVVAFASVLGWAWWDGAL